MQLDHSTIATVSRLFEPLGDVVFCVKDRAGVYTQVNAAFLARAGLRTKREAVGKTAAALFPPALAEAYSRQDDVVIATGRELADCLERIPNEDGSVGWYLAHKFPLVDAAGAVTGVIGLSQDLHTPTEGALQLARLGDVVRHIQENYGSLLRVEDLAAGEGLTAAQFERRMKRVFGLSPKQFITKVRIEAATEMLENTGLSLSEIALRCGFSDQSAFTRQFRATTGLTPGTFRVGR